MLRNIREGMYRLAITFTMVYHSEEHYQYVVELTFKLLLDVEFLSFDLAHSAIV